jgi:predicted nuclease of predicted toxin-antitoxin system
MNFKLDENFGARTQRIFQEYGHSVETVRSQKLEGCADTQLYAICCAEGRCLVTLDLDFSDVLRFPPEQGSGTVVIRVPQNPSLVLLERLVRQFLQTLTQMSVSQQLWIVEVGRIRVHQARIDD